MADESNVRSGLQASIIPVLKWSNGAPLVLIFAIFVSHIVFAQGSRTAIVHGHANDVAGIAFKKSSIKLYNYNAPNFRVTQFLYSFAVDDQGDFHGAGIEPGKYVLGFYRDDELVDYTVVDLPGGRDTAVSFDMRRKEFADRLTPERKAANARYVDEMTKLVAARSQGADLNTKLVQSREKMQAGDYDAAILLMQSAVEAKPDEGLFWYTLGDAQLGAKRYDDAISSYSKALTSRINIKSRTELAASAENNLGMALANAGKSEEAITAFDAAARYDPTKAGKYYLNEAVVLRNLNHDDEAFIAANKVIAADPAAAEAYYIRAQVLVGRAVKDPVTGKLMAPPDCVEAYHKYLELEPNGRFAPEVKEILAALGQPIETSYKKRQ
jgi:tetratricopeptide (TPR) repeat protein